MMLNNLQRKGMDRVIYFPTDLVAYAFVGVSFSEDKIMGGEYLNKLYNLIY